MCTETPYLHSLCLEMPGVWTRGENLIRNRKKRGSRRRRKLSVKICASCIKNAAAVRPDFSSRREKMWQRCDSALNVNRVSKELFLDGCLHSAWLGLGSPTVGDIQPTEAVCEWHEPGVAAAFSCTFSSATCTNQTRKHLKGTEKRAP